MQSAPTPPTRARSTFRRWVLLWCSVGIALRLALLFLAGEPELTSDEAGYVYLALGWLRFDFLGDAERFLWPPGWPFVLRVAFEWFGLHFLTHLSLDRWVVRPYLALGVAYAGDNDVLAQRLNFNLAAGVRWRNRLMEAHHFNNTGLGEPNRGQDDYTLSYIWEF